MYKLPSLFSNCVDVPQTEDRIHDMFLNTPISVPIAVRIESISVFRQVYDIVSHTTRIDIKVVVKHRANKWEDPDMASTTLVIRSDGTYCAYDENDRLPLGVLAKVHRVLEHNGYVHSHAYRAK